MSWMKKLECTVTSGIKTVLWVIQRSMEMNLGVK